MAYILTHTDGTALITLEDGLNDTSTTSLSLFGKNYPGYGLPMNENFIKLLENFSATTPPPAPTSGQLWWDNGAKQLKAYSGNAWGLVGGVVSEPVAPSAPQIGEIWWDTTNQVLKLWTGTAWGIVSTVLTNVDVDVVNSLGVNDISNVPHTVATVTIGGVITAVISKDPTFTVATIPGFGTIMPGINLLNSGVINGTATNALALDGIAAGNFLRSDVVNPSLNISGNLIATGTVTSTFIGNLTGTVTGTATSAASLNSASVLPSGTTATTQPYGNNTTLLATTGFVANAIGNITSGVSSFNSRLGNVTLTTSDVTTALTYAPVNKSGDTMAGNLILNADPVLTLGAATKGYVDSTITATIGNITSGVSSFNTRTGNITLTSTDVTTALTYAPVNKSGDTMVGNLILNANPTVPLGAATKGYVDASIPTITLSNIAPIIDSNVGLPGTSNVAAREDHVHPTDLRFYDISGGSTGIPTPSAIMLTIIAVRPFTLPAGLVGSLGTASAAATASTTFTINKNGVAIGSINFAAGATSATFSLIGTTTFNVSDILTIVSPAVPDATLANIGFTLASFPGLNIYNTVLGNVTLIETGLNGQVLTSTGNATAPVWANVPTVTVTSVAIANNIAGGTAMAIPYQTAANTTAFVTAGINGQVLTSTGPATAPIWTTPAATITLANTVPVIDSTVASAGISTLAARADHVHPTDLRFYDFSGGTIGAPTASAKILTFIAVRSFTLPIGLTTSRGMAGVAATAITTFTINKNGVAIGTMAFAAAATTATFTMASATSFVAGDYITVVAPVTPDATLADIGLTIAGVV